MSRVKNPNEFSFIEHLDEARIRLLRTLAVVSLAAVVIYSFVDPLLSYILRPVGQVVFTSPADAFTARILVAFYGAVFVSFPYVLFEVWQFVRIALTLSEVRRLTFFGPLTLICFGAGGAFGYFVIVPISMQFLLGFATDSMVPMITVKNYISFVGTLVLAFGVIFELPLVLMFLTKIGIATPEFLVQKRRHAIVILLIISAFITPPDLVTQILLAVPLILLYECGIFFSRMVYRKDAAQ